MPYRLFADGRDPLTALDIADSVTVHLYSATPEGEDEPAPVVSVESTAIDPEQGAITIGGKAVPEGFYLKVGTYSHSSGETGVLIYKVHYNPETEEHYIEYDSDDASECFEASDTDLENGTSDFSFATETRTKTITLRFLPEDYDINEDLNTGIQLEREDEPGAVYAYKHWTHYSQDGSHCEEYSVVKLQYSETMGCYVEDTSYEGDVFYDPADLKTMGFEIVLSNQPLEYVTKGDIDLIEYPVYTAADGSRYYVDYDNNVYAYSDSNTITLQETTYYVGELREDISVDDLSDTEHDVATGTYRYWIDGPEYHHTADGQSEGAEVTVNITSFLDDQGVITLSVKDSRGEDCAIGTLKGNKMQYIFRDVPDDTYTLTVSKKNHVSRTYTVAVSGDTSVDVKIHPLGDISGDGKITNIDYTRAKAHARGGTQLKDYELKVADVIKNDGLVTGVDATRIKSVARGNSSLW